MRRSAWASGVAAVAVALSLIVAACGSSSDEGNKPSGGNQNTTAGKPTENAKRGGKLTVLWAGDVDHIDCGASYYQMGIFICDATQRQLYAYKPDDGVNMQPDIADGPPEVSEDGKTVTIKIK